MVSTRQLRENAQQIARSGGTVGDATNLAEVVYELAKKVMALEDVVERIQAAR